MMEKLDYLNLLIFPLFLFFSPTLIITFFKCSAAFRPDESDSHHDANRKPEWLSRASMHSITAHTFFQKRIRHVKWRRSTKNVNQTQKKHPRNKKALRKKLPSISSYKNYCCRTRIWKNKNTISLEIDNSNFKVQQYALWLQPHVADFKYKYITKKSICICSIYINIALIIHNRWVDIFLTRIRP